LEALDRRTASGGMDDTECDDNDESDSTISDFYEGFFFEFGCGGGGGYSRKNEHSFYGHFFLNWVSHPVQSLFKLFSAMLRIFLGKKFLRILSAILFFS